MRRLPVLAQMPRRRRGPKLRRRPHLLRAGRVPSPDQRSRVRRHRQLARRQRSGQPLALRGSQEIRLGLLAVARKSHCRCRRQTIRPRERAMVHSCPPRYQRHRAGNLYGVPRRSCNASIRIDAHHPANEGATGDSRRRGQPHSHRRWLRAEGGRQQGKKMRDQTDLRKQSQCHAGR
jgi:hypothetical protein